MAEHRVITYDGIRVPTQDGKETLVKWEDLRQLSPDQQAKVLGTAGLSKAEQTSLMDKINKGAQIAGSGDLSAVLGEGGYNVADIPGWHGGKTTWQELGLNKLSDQLMKERADKAGMANRSSQFQAITGEALGNEKQQKEKVAQGLPAMSKENLDQYLHEFVLPLIKTRQDAIAGEMSGLQNMLGTIKGAPQNPVMQMMAPDLQAREQDLARDTVISQTLGPYLQTANNAISAQYQTGEAARSQGASLLTLMQAIFSNPGLAQAVGASSGINFGATGTGVTGGISALNQSPVQNISNLAQNIGTTKVAGQP